MGIAWPCEWIIEITKFSQFKVIGKLDKKCLKWEFAFKKRIGLTVYEICDALESMGPIREREIYIIK